MSLEISADSSKEEVANYFFKEFKISEESKNNFIKEDISGDVLLDVTDFKIFGVKTGPLMKIKKFIKNNEEKLKPKKEFEEKITTKSSIEEVKASLKTQESITEIRLCYLAAAVANLRCTQIFGARETALATYAGNLLKESDLSHQVRFAEQLVNSYKALCGDLLKEENFFFSAVRG